MLLVPEPKGCWHGDCVLCMCHCPPFPVPRGAPSVPALLCLSAQSLVHVLHICPWEGWGGLAPDWARWDPVLIQSVPVAQYPLSLPSACSLGAAPGWVSGRLLPMGPQTLLCRGSCRTGFSGPRCLSQPLLPQGCEVPGLPSPLRGTHGWKGRDCGAGPWHLRLLSPARSGGIQD